LAAVEREITLRDYGRVLWSGRWVLLVAAVAAGLVGLIVSLVRETRYTATSTVYLGLVTTPRTGQPVPTPLTTPLTAQRVLRGDRFIQAAADGAGVGLERVRDGVSFTVDRIPGAAGGNQPVVAQIRYEDRNRPTAIKVVNAYADAVFAFRDADYQKVIEPMHARVEDLETRSREIRADLGRLRGRSDVTSAVLLTSLQQELGTLLDHLDEANVDLAKTRVIEAPYIVSRATSASSSARPGQRVRTVVFAILIGLILGAIVVFIWRGGARREDA
jgi:uncharacterized protein involved in exopolysaccharide biosynthesis